MNTQQTQELNDLQEFLENSYKYDAGTNQFGQIERYVQLKSLETKQKPDNIVNLTSAEVLALNTTPQEIVPAQGATKAVVIDKVVGYVDYNSAAYATNTTIEFRYTNGAGAKVATDMAALLTATADKVVSVGGVASEVVAVANAPVVAVAATADPVTGDSPISLHVWYKVADVDQKSAVPA